ncbi:hypothetical protein [Agromyces sp. NPDC057865]|uniref:hypothetical protein n=1 Tax=Agromyces sp. NPDC057865 TaxID=3346267 RepID=UPI0036735C99
MSRTTSITRTTVRTAAATLTISPHDGRVILSQPSRRPADGADSLTPISVRVVVRNPSGRSYGPHHA